MDSDHVLKMFRALPLGSIRIRMNPDGGTEMCTVQGYVGDQGVELQLLLNSKASAGSWYMSEPSEAPRTWLGRCFAGRC